jgi:hypothetical protein
VLLLPKQERVSKIDKKILNIEKKELLLNTYIKEESKRRKEPVEIIKRGLSQEQYKSTQEFLEDPRGYLRRTKESVEKIPSLGEYFEDKTFGKIKEGSEFTGRKFKEKVEDMKESRRKAKEERWYEEEVIKEEKKRRAPEIETIQIQRLKEGARKYKFVEGEPDYAKKYKDSIPGLEVTDFATGEKLKDTGEMGFVEVKPKSFLERAKTKIKDIVYPAEKEFEYKVEKETKERLRKEDIDAEAAEREVARQEKMTEIAERKERETEERESKEAEVQERKAMIEERREERKHRAEARIVDAEMRRAEVEERKAEKETKAEPEVTAEQLVEEI